MLTSRSEIELRKNRVYDFSPQANKSVNSDSSLLASNITKNQEQLAQLESAKEQLRMATIERKRMTSINACPGGNKPKGRYGNNVMPYRSLNLDSAQKMTAEEIELDEFIRQEEQE